MGGLGGGGCNFNLWCFPRKRCRNYICRFVFPGSLKGSPICFLAALGSVKGANAIAFFCLFIFVIFTRETKTKLTLSNANERRFKVLMCFLIGFLLNAGNFLSALQH